MTLAAALTDPRVVAAMIGGGVVAGGWVVTHLLSARRDRAARAERVRDVQGALYAAYGTESPFLPSFLGERGLTPGEIGIALAAGTLMRLGAGPIAGHLADRYDAARAVLATAAAAAGLISFAYLAGFGFWPGSTAFEPTYGETFSGTPSWP